MAEDDAHIREPSRRTRAWQLLRDDARDLRGRASRGWSCSTRPRRSPARPPLGTWRSRRCSLCGARRLPRGTKAGRAPSRSEGGARLPRRAGWNSTLSTVQVDVSMPMRSGSLRGPRWRAHRPAMLQRRYPRDAGTLHRPLYGMTGGDFPSGSRRFRQWCSPSATPCRVRERRGAALRRGGPSRRNRRAQRKTRLQGPRGQEQKITLMLVVGDQEQADGTVTPRCGTARDAARVPWRAMPRGRIRPVHERTARRARQLGGPRSGEFRRAAKKPVIPDQRSDPGAAGPRDRQRWRTAGCHDRRGRPCPGGEEGLDLVEVAPAPRRRSAGSWTTGATSTSRRRRPGRARGTRRRSRRSSSGHAPTTTTWRPSSRTRGDFLMEGDKVKVTVMYRGGRWCTASSGDSSSIE